MGFDAENLLMSNVSNYQGDLVIVDALKNPLTTYLGVRDEIEGTNFEEVGSMLFNMSQAHTLDAPSQPAVTENQTIAAIASGVNKGVQVTNALQVFTAAVNASPIKLANKTISGNAIDGEALLLQVFAPQIKFHREQIKANYEFSVWNGVFSDGSANSDTAFQIRGILNAADIASVDALNLPVTVDLINEVLQKMADGGADFEDVQLHCRSDLKIAVGKLYALAPRDRTLGGVNITRIETDFGEVSLVWNPKIPADTIGFVDAANCKLVSNTVPGGVPFGMYGIASVSMAQKRQLYGHLGIDYKHGCKHGKLIKVKAK